MEFNFSDIEQEIKEFWEKNDVFRTEIDHSKPKYYMLDMFPYPSGAGLHVGHPLGYIASDIIARYKRLKGFNVLHPMGYDSFGLPAEQYAIQTGQHPAITTEENIKTFRSQLDKLGFSYDWSRQLKTSDPEFYKWTQWIFIKMFHAWYNQKTDRAEGIDLLIAEFERNGNGEVKAACSETKIFTASEWRSFSEKEQSDILLNYRLAYIADSWVNWCAALGTVLANDEVKDGVSERGGYPVERKLMKQWSLRITAYADRLLKGLDEIDWSESIKESQRNWIGKSEGCTVRFTIKSASVPPLLRRGAGGEDQKPGTDQTAKFLTANPTMAAYLQNEAAKSRKDPTKAEKILWERLRNRKLGDKFRRQHPIGDFIPDFVCLSKKLIVELDGEQHKEMHEYDVERTRILNGLGFEVIRFWNGEVEKNVNEVVDKIKNALQTRNEVLTPNPSPGERGNSSANFDGGASIEVFTTRPDTIFGVSFITLAPEHELVSQIVTEEYKKQVDEYVTYATNRSERERMAEVKKITGQFTGAYAEHPFSGEDIPIWIGEYVLAGYGTGAVMAVPAHDSRDYAFAKFFEKELTEQLGHNPIVEVISGGDVSKESYDAKEGICVNSDFLNGLQVKDAIQKAIEEIEKEEIGTRRINFKLRDAIFGRQRYWGEPIPIYYDEAGIPKTMEERDLPLVLPEVDKYLPTETGEPPLARATDWKYKGKYEYELTTMPGWAGSNWYFLRYEDPHNRNEFASKEAIDYWQNVDFYLGGSEHATGHLLYFRFCTQFLFDLGFVPFTEPAKKLLNQGMIQGVSQILFATGVDFKNRIGDSLSPLKIPSKTGIFEIQNDEKFLNPEFKNLAGINLILYSPDEEIRNYFDSIEKSTSIDRRIQIQFVKDNVVNLADYISSPMGADLDYAIFLADGGYWFKNQFYRGNGGSDKVITKGVVEKMSKRYGNVVNPDDVVKDYGADAFRLYEMFLGPIDQSKPWDTKGIDGVYRFLKKMWKLFYDEHGNWLVTNDTATKDELKVLHQAIKKVQEDVERLSFNTSVSAFMICVNELTQLNCRKKEILEKLLVILSPYAPFVTEYLWLKLGNEKTIIYASFPQYDESLLVENEFEYPIAINGKTRVKMNFALDLSSDQIEKEVLDSDAVKKYFDGKTPKKVIVVKGRMINVVV